MGKTNVLGSHFSKSREGFCPDTTAILRRAAWVAGFTYHEGGVLRLGSVRQRPKGQVVLQLLAQVVDVLQVVVHLSQESLHLTT